MSQDSHPQRIELTRRKALEALVAAFSSAFVVKRVDSETVELSQQMIDASLASLANRQNEDGSFGRGAELFGRDPGVAALAGLAFLASGSLPGRGRFGRELNEIVRLLLSRSIESSRDNFGLPSEEKEVVESTQSYLEENNLTRDEIDGLIADLRGRGRKPTYGHGYAVLFLSEILGATGDKTLRSRVESAVGLIEKTQNDEGGWRYAPAKVAVADLSVTTCQICALRSARNAGVYVKEETIARALDYVKSLQNEDGGFRYMSLAGPSGYGRTAAAICALQAGGQDENDATARGFRYLEKEYLDVPKTRTEEPKIEYRRYAQFYASLAYWRASTSEEGARRWRRFFTRLETDILSERATDGLWESNISTEADSAFAICALSIPQERTSLFLR